MVDSKERKLVYLMDDMPLLSRMYSEVLGRHGYDSTIGQNADEALSVLTVTARKPVCIVLDVNVPGSMNGLELCRRLRADERYKRVGIVLLTANAGTEPEAWAAGCDAFFTKPCRLDSLVEVIDALSRAAD